MMARRRTAAAWRPGICALALLLLAFGIGPAAADVAAGRAAFEKGDYARAMSEWQRAADQGDADAEFGLGQLYEFGAGDLPQDYKRADYWYRKAAGQGNSEAEYRLALIWSAGAEGLPPDFVEAYGWAVLAAASKGVWGSLAAELKAQLETVTSPQQQAEGKKRAETWKATVATAAPAPKPTPGPAVAPATTSTTTTKASGGCPGWPFPTLPCTEQFPALPGVAAPKTPPKPAIQAPANDEAPAKPAPPRSEAAPDPAAPQRVAAAVNAPGPPAPHPPPSPAQKPLDRLNEALAQIDCAALEARTEPLGAAVVYGSVPDLEQRARLARLVAQLVPAHRPQLKVEVVPPPICRSLSGLAALRRSGALADGGLELRLANGSSLLREGDAIELSVKSPGYDAALRIDYFPLDGRVQHLWPNTAYAAARIAASGTQLFWDAGGGKTWNAGGAPFGTELITAIATAAPLALGTRPPVEPAADYLRDLKSVLPRQPSPAAAPSMLATLLVRTGPR
jgi:hypothetical protein